MPQDLPEPIRRYIDAYNSKDVAGMMRCLSNDVTFRDLSGGQVNAVANNKDEFGKLAEKALPLFVYRRQTITNYITVSQTTLVEIDYEALLAVDLPNGMSAGQTLQLSGRSLFRIAAGKITSLIDES